MTVATAVAVLSTALGTLLALFWIFFKIGLFTFGGGYSIIYNGTTGDMSCGGAGAANCTTDLID